jgi:hypothetical protein
MARFSLLLLLPLFLIACDPQQAPQLTCPYLRQYEPALIERALQEYRALPKGSALRTLIGDYELLRDQVRSCQQSYQRQ